MIEHPRTGEQVELELRTPETLVMQVTWTRPGQRAVGHVHPGMEEHYEVLEGTPAFRVGGAESRAGAGEPVGPLLAGFRREIVLAPPAS